MEIDRSEFLRRLYILIIIRCCLGIVFLAVSLAIYLKNRYDLFSLEFFPIYIYALMLLFFTVLSGILFKCFKEDKKIVFYGILQLCFDLFSVSLFVYFSGGVLSPFPIFYVPVIIMASFLFGRKGGILSGLISFALYGFLVDLQYYGYIKPFIFIGMPWKNLSAGLYLYNLFIYIVSFFITGILSGLVVEKWHIAEEHLKSTLSSIRFIRSLHEKILENIPSGVIVTDKDHYVIYANKGASNILSMSLRELRRKDLLSILPIPKEVSRIPRSEFNYPDPETKKLKVIGYGVHPIEETPNVRGWIFLFQDLTEVKRMEREISEAERLAFAGKIAAEIAHNIKNPLGTISGAAQMIAKQENDEVILERLTGILIKEVNKIDAIIKSFLKISRVTFSPAIRSKVYPTAELKRIISNFLAQEDVDGKYNIQVVKEIEPEVYTDINVSEFETAVWNLLENAKEAMITGGKIVVSTEVVSLESEEEKPVLASDHSTYIRIDVRDYGAGIPKDISEKVFEPFFTTKKKGTGLGLSIVSQIMKKFNGFVKCDSSEGSTVFSIFLPAFFE